MLAIHVEVVGRVQGVGFRWYVREHGRRCGLAGWVRNLPSGHVEVVAQGAVQAVEEFRKVLETGPGGARVDRLIDRGSPDSADFPFPFAIYA